MDEQPGGDRPQARITARGSRTTLMVPVKNRAHFLDMYFEKAGIGGLFIAGMVGLDLGDEIDLEVNFLEEHMHFRIRGEVRWRRSRGSSKALPPGVGIEFVAEDNGTRKLLLDYAMGKEVTMVHRGSRRFPAAIPVKAKGPAGTAHGTTDDVSEGGAFVLLQAAFAVDQVIDVVLKTPGKLFGIGLRARVAWTRGDGVGLEFLFDSAKKKARVERLVAEIKSKAIDELLVRVPRPPRPSDEPS